MPRYDYRCAGGHTIELVQSRETDKVPCPVCGSPAQRLVLSPPGINGFTPKPTKEHYVNLNRAVEAQHELVHAAAKSGTVAPDFYQIAKDRIERGDVKAIE